MHPSIVVIGITGSVGKTTTKEILASVLGAKYTVLKSEKNFDPIFNIPQTLLKIRGEEKLVLEMGVDGFGQMKKYLSLVKPQIGVVTRFSLAHSDEEHFGSLDGLISEKSELIKALPKNGWAVLNGDDENVVKLKKLTKARVIFYGFSKTNDFIVRNYLLRKNNSGVRASFDLEWKQKRLRIQTKLLGRQNAMCIAAAVTVALIESVSVKEIEGSIKKIEPVEQRLCIKKSIWGGLVIDDTYNASPEAVRAAIDLLVDIDESNVLVLGQMKELGKLSRESHFEVGKYAKKMGVKNVIVMGEDAGEVIRGYEGGRVCRNINDIVSELNKLKPRVVLIKGSRGMAMERVVKEIVLY